MNMKNWAENEIKIACKNENPNWDGKSFDYGCACYQSALKAYKSMLDDDHSGFSWGLTSNILKRLLDDLPLTSIEDKDFVQDSNMPQSSEEELKDRKLKSDIQCPRMPSLFRYEHLDGKIEYHDVNRAYCFNIDNPHITYTSHLCKIIDELYPITMPYYPSINKYKIAVEERLYDKSLGDYDLIRIPYIIEPNGNKKVVNRCYRSVIRGYKKYKSLDFIRPVEELVKISYSTYKKLSKTQIESKYREGVDSLEVVDDSSCECIGS